MVPSGTCVCHTAVGLRASPDGGHEEVDGSAVEERAGFFCAAALHGCHRGEDGALTARCGTGLHQSAQQGEVPDSITTLCNFRRRIKKELGMNTKSVMLEQNNLASNTGTIYRHPPQMSGLCWFEDFLFLFVDHRHKFRAFKSYSLVFDIK